MPRRMCIANFVLRWLPIAGTLGAVGLVKPPPRLLAWPNADHPPMQEQTVEETYRRECSACHGAEGRGDGRSARRYNPRPPDFTEPEGVARLSDEEIIDIVTNGRAAMPSFGDVLGAEAISRLVEYVRDLSRGGEAGGRGS